VASPDPTGTLTLQDTPSFLGATTDEAQRRAGEPPQMFDGVDDARAARCPARPLQPVDTY
jgi:hypothetical protein